MTVVTLVTVYLDLHLHAKTKVASPFACAAPALTHPVIQIPIPCLREQDHVEAARCAAGESRCRTSVTCATPMSDVFQTSLKDSRRRFCRNAGYGEAPIGASHTESRE